MKIAFMPRQKGNLDLGLVYGGIGIFALLGLRLFSQLTLLFPPCPFHRLTGIPCPTCGATRCGLLLSQFHILEAFLVNPLFVLTCFGVAAWAVSALALLVMRKEVRFHLGSEMRPVLRFALIGCIALNWVYLIYASA